MSRQTIIAGNWKMYKTGDDAATFVQALAGISATVYLAVPFTAIAAAKKAAKGGSIRIGAQNMHDATEGAFTGEISGAMLRDVGAEFVLLGHSERRHVFGETDEFINRKVHRAQSDGLQPILCVGETLEQREAGEMESVLRGQIESSLAGVESLSDLILAYEPVWAIGTGRTATPQQAQEAHAFCRGAIAEKWGQEAAQGISLLYGGSVKPDNAAELLAQPDIDGVLVGGASLEVDSFKAIAQCNKIKASS